MLYENQASWENLDDPKEIFEGYAQTAGLDIAKFREIMNSDEAKKAVEAGESEAIGLGLNSTPSFFINKNQVKPASYDDFKKLIDEELLKDKPLQ
jgi:protein-disulfide isomerase